MQTIPSIQNAKRVAISNMVRTMAQSPHSLEIYTQLNRALKEGKLSPKLRVQIALIVAQANGCEYSLVQHASRARQLGLSKEEIVASQCGRTADAKTNTALQFARNLVLRNADVAIMSLRESGFDNAEIVEIVAHVSLNSFENHFNDIAETSLDFPKLAARAAA